MKAIAVFPATRTIDLIRAPVPEITSPTQVKARIVDVGICGTDKEIVSFLYGTPPAGSDHLIIGHESLGEVVEVGQSVSKVKVGQLVVIMVRRPCPDPNCVACRSGRQDFCYTGDYRERGIKEENGFMTEYVVDDERYFFVVPKELRQIGVLTEPLTIAEKALIQILEIQKRLPWACTLHPGSTVPYCRTALMLGAGPVGLLGCMAFIVAGFKAIVYSLESEKSDRAEIARQIGAEYMSSENHSPEELAARLDSIDVVYEATGAAPVAFQVLEHLGTNGIFVFTGVPGRKYPVQLDSGTLMRNMVLKNQAVLGTVNAGAEAHDAAIRDLKAFMQRWPDIVPKVISHRYKPEQFREPLLGKVSAIKQVISFE